MRGDDRQQAAMFSYISPEQRVPTDHPRRPIRAMVDEILRGLSPQFDALYARAAAWTARGAGSTMCSSSGCGGA
jgi:hypothetical protein